MLCLKFSQIYLWSLCSGSDFISGYLFHIQAYLWSPCSHSDLSLVTLFIFRYNLVHVKIYLLSSYSYSGVSLVTSFMFRFFFWSRCCDSGLSLVNFVHQIYLWLSCSCPGLALVTLFISKLSLVTLFIFRFISAYLKGHTHSFALSSSD